MFQILAKTCQVFFVGHVINKHIWKKIAYPALQPTVSLVAYTNVTVVTMGTFANVQKLPIIVIDQQDTPLFGLDWFVAFNIKMPNGVNLHNVKLLEGMEMEDFALKALLSEFAEFFKDNSTTIQGDKPVMHLKDGTTA